MRRLAAACLIWLCATSVWADARLTVLMDALRLPDLVQIMRQEGLSDAEQINIDMLAGQGGAFWLGQVDGLYNPIAMQDMFFAGLRDGLDDGDLQVAVDFFDSARGQRIVNLEMAARQAMIDPDVRATASEAYDALQTTDDPHAEFVAQMVEANDALELNVAVTMSTSYQFYRGLSDGGFLRRPEADILADVWDSEPSLRAEAQDWLFAYFLLAYQPLAPEDRDAYLAFFESSSGQALNSALFTSFEAMFTDIAYGLGRAVALNAVGNDI
ncbi:MAG: DUF2059 domain-containing protein [Paracoccaceae bacterium]|nr:DUF2059 domain-containing protein [Paracoccaceae bacterium]